MREFADVEHACLRHGVGPAELDRLEVWRVATVLGQHLPPDGAQAAPAGVNPAVLRAEAQAKGLPEPTAARPSPGPDAALRTLIPSMDAREHRR